MLLTASIVTTGVLIVQQVHERYRLYDQVLELRLQQDDALSELSKLQIERGSERSYDRVVEVATSELTMTFPKELVSPTRESEE